MTFGVGVEGPSDFQFWHKVLHKHFRGCRFDVRNMKNRDKLIRETPKLLETFRYFWDMVESKARSGRNSPCPDSIPQNLNL